MSTSYDFDLIVIGSGPAGEKGAAQAAYFGHKVAIIEKEAFPGGAAANTGTLPSKTLRESALFFSGFRHRELRGFHVQMRSSPSIKDFMEREKIVTETERHRIIQNIEVVHKVPLIFQGEARFLNDHTVAVLRPDGSESQFTAANFLIATGSRPFRPPAFRIADPRICDSDTILDLDEYLQELPHAMVVIGGGVIGCEYACIFSALGVKIFLIEKSDRIIGSMDKEISETLKNFLIASGVEILFSEEVLEVVPERRVTVRLNSGRNILTDAVLVSSGRYGNTSSLGLENLGVSTNSRHQLSVNEFYQLKKSASSPEILPHVFAAGDVIGNPALASTAMEQARVAMTHAFHLGYKEAVSPILPYGIYTIPECSSAGLTEEEAKAKNIPYIVGRAWYEKNARGQILGDHRGFLKLIFSDDDAMKLLGVHMIGEQATELIHVGLTALMVNAGADLFIRTCYNYPTLTETYKYATYNAMGIRKARLENARKSYGDAS